MKTTLAILFLVIGTLAYGQKNTDYIIPEQAKIEVLLVKEAYSILDSFSERIWPGWQEFRNHPIQLSFQNNLEILINHPAPPESFYRYNDPDFVGLSVYVDNTDITSLDISHPLKPGGGLFYGGRHNGKPLWMVKLDLRKGDEKIGSEDKQCWPESHILVFIHELIHCYQRDHVTAPYGNLSVNPDKEYSLYGTLEGMALSKAWQAESEEETKRYLKHFLQARERKYEFLTEREKLEASCDEIMEGMAVYSELRTLDLLENSNYRNPSLFKNIPELKDKYEERLEEYTYKMLEVYEKNYEYGAFQALLLRRLFSDWEKELEEGRPFYLLLADRQTLNEADSLEFIRSLQSEYAFDSLNRLAENIIRKRNQAYKEAQSRDGIEYVVSFKPIKYWVDHHVEESVPSYAVVLMTLYPEGIGHIKTDEVEVEFKKECFLESNQLYHFRIVDEEMSGGKECFQILEGRFDDEKGIYYDAVIETPFFLLKAPQLSISKRKNRIKFIVHSRV